ncbi:sulfotransferase 1C2-like [Littorina saxatilis]|uniref:sulfotransferase 1C2-like n=1 Tax=Littorina saxatilis TaxID=31220 RepID=UPI0038B59CA3
MELCEPGIRTLFGTRRTMTEVRVPDGGGSSLHLVEVDGFRYPPFPEDCIRAVRGLDIRPDDVLVCAYPKSGTHWAWELVRQLLANDESAGAKHGQKELDVKEKDDGMLEMTSQEQLQAMPSPRVLNTHVYFDQLPTQVAWEVGDWKNVFTVAQAEEFAKVYKAKVKELLVIRSAATVDGTPSHIPLAARYNTQL